MRNFKYKKVDQSMPVPVIMNNNENLFIVKDSTKDLTAILQKEAMIKYGKDESFKKDGGEESNTHFILKRGFVLNPNRKMITQTTIQPQANTNGSGHKNKQNTVVNLHENYDNSNYEDVTSHKKKVVNQVENSTIYQHNCNTPNINQSVKSNKDEKKRLSYLKSKKSKGIIDYKTYANNRQEELNAFHNSSYNINGKPNFVIEAKKENLLRNKE